MAASSTCRFIPHAVAQPPTPPQTVMSTEVSNETAEASTSSLPEIHLAAQRGDVDSLRKLVSHDNVNLPAYDGSYPLQWAASGNHWEATAYLLEQKADPNLKGPMDATVLHWVARKGLVYIAKLLIEAGADTTAVDDQHYTPLHVSVHSSNVLMVIYLLHLEQPGDPNARDLSGRTPLHWAAYQGDNLTTQSLIRAGADPNIKDSQGFIPLHWALVSKNQSCLQELIAAQSDLTAKTNEGKSCWVIAEEMDARDPWSMALQLENRRPESGIIVPRKLSLRSAKLFLFLLPFILCPIFIHIILIPYAGVPLCLVLGLIIHALCSKYVYPVIQPGPGSFLKSPILAGIYNGMFFWIVFVYFYDVLPSTWYELMALNITMITLWCLIVLFYTCAALLDPGTISPGTTSSRRDDINELLNNGLYDGEHFSVQVWTRKPPRSQYSRFTNTVIARFDHYCPWVYNAIGIRNHRSFMLYLTCLSIAAFVGGKLYWSYLRSLDISLWGSVSRTKFSVIMCLGIFIQVCWIELLTITQYVQISRGLTTEEILDRHAPESFSSLPYDHPEANRALPLSSFPAILQPPRRKDNALGKCMKLLGVHQAMVTTKAVTRKKKNNLGVFTNCGDFWCTGPNVFKPSCKGRLNGKCVDYSTIRPDSNAPRIAQSNSNAENALRRIV